MTGKNSELPRVQQAAMSKNIKAGKMIEENIFHSSRDFVLFCFQIFTYLILDLSNYSLRCDQYLRTIDWFSSTPEADKHITCTKRIIVGMD